MKLFLIQTVYQCLLPPGGIILLLLAFNIYGYRKRWKKQRILSVIIAVLYFLSIRIGADMLARPLEETYTPPVDIQGDVLLMVGYGSLSSVPGVGGAGQPSPIMSRSMLVTAELYRKTHLPILVAGGVTFSNTISEADIALREFGNLGIPAGDLYEDRESRNTVENARNAAVICEEHHWKQPILLAAAIHAPRAAMIFRREGLDVTVYPTCYLRQASYSGSSISYFIPNAENLEDSAMALKEYIGIAAIKMGLQ